MIDVDRCKTLNRSAIRGNISSLRDAVAVGSNRNRAGGAVRYDGRSVNGSIRTQRDCPCCTGYLVVDCNALARTPGCQKNITAAMGHHTTLIGSNRDITVFSGQRGITCTHNGALQQLVDGHGTGDSDHIDDDLSIALVLCRQRVNVAVLHINTGLRCGCQVRGLERFPGKSIYVRRRFGLLNLTVFGVEHNIRAIGLHFIVNHDVTDRVQCDICRGIEPVVRIAVIGYRNTAAKNHQFIMKRRLIRTERTDSHVPGVRIGMVVGRIFMSNDDLRKAV